MFFNGQCFLLLGVFFTFHVTHVEAGFLDNILKAFENILFSERCFNHLGCFSNGPPYFDLFTRPISLLPDSNLKTEFLLFTPTTVNKSYQLHLNKASILNSTYDAKIPTKILLPGYLINLEPNDEFFLMKDKILAYGNFNIIVVDWSKSNNFPYAQAFANGRVVGAQIAYLLKLIKRNIGISFKKVHMIGHSLGAHICGWAGKRINKIGRITALDPAGPYFQDSPKQVRLDQSDAIFVDVIHTDSGDVVENGLSLKQRIGHEDFYPNGGTQQPGCKNNRTILNFFGIKADACDHSISRTYFMSSITDCQYDSIQCESYDAFEKRYCTSSNSLVVRMGFHAKKITNLQGSRKFYLYTSSTPPYCSVNDSSLN